MDDRQERNGAQRRGGGGLSPKVGEHEPKSGGGNLCPISTSNLGG